MPTFNGFNILNPPVTLSPGSNSIIAPAQIEYRAYDAVSANTNPFTFQQQLYSWGNSVMEWGITMPDMTNSNAIQWAAWLMSLQGALNIFQLGDPRNTTVSGSGSVGGGGPNVRFANQTGYSLTTKNWTFNATNVLLPGDWIQIGYRLYRVVAPVNADSIGNATISIWPNIRESPADNDSIILSNTKGMWRLKTSDRKWSISEMRTYGFTFDIREAI